MFSLSQADIVQNLRHGSYKVNTETVLQYLQIPVSALAVLSLMSDGQMGNPVFYFGNVPALTWYFTYPKHPHSPFSLSHFLKEKDTLKIQKKHVRQGHI